MRERRHDVLGVLLVDDGLARSHRDRRRRRLYRRQHHRDRRGRHCPHRQVAEARCQHAQIGERWLLGRGADVRIGKGDEHLREALGGDLVLGAIERRLGDDVALLNERREQTLARVAEHRAQPGRHVVHVRPIERIARDHRLDGLVRFVGVADRDQTERAIELDRLTLLRRRTRAQQSVQHRQRALVVSRGVELACAGE